MESNDPYNYEAVKTIGRCVPVGVSRASLQAVGSRLVMLCWKLVLEGGIGMLSYVTVQGSQANVPASAWACKY